MFSSWNWEKITQVAEDNIQKDCKIHIEVPEKYLFAEKFSLKEITLHKNSR